MSALPGAVRLAPVPADEGERRAIALGLPAATGRLLAFRVLANHPELARGVFTQHAALRHRGLLSDRHRELIIMRVAWRSRSAYEWAQHWSIALGLGLTADQLVAVRNWRGSALFDAADRAVLGVVDEVFDLGRVSDVTWQACLYTLGDAHRAIEAVAATTHWRGLAALFASLDLPLEDGALPWPPDGIEPSAD